MSSSCGPTVRNRRRDARHPIVLASMGTLSYIAASQLWFGPGGSEVVSTMNSSLSQDAFSALLLVSALACIISAFIGHPPRSPNWRDSRVRGAVIEMLGMFGIAVALLFYSFDIPAAVPHAWNTSMALAFTGTAIGAAVRAGLIIRMIRHRETW